MFGKLEKILAVLTFGPPLYMLFRFVRWALRHKNQYEEE